MMPSLKLADLVCREIKISGIGDASEPAFGDVVIFVAGKRTASSGISPWFAI
jgi:hypothetical protein